MHDIEEIYRRYALPVKKYVYGMCRNEALADDVTAETFYKAIKNIDSFGSGNMLTWLCSIARNTYIDCIRKKEYKNLPFPENADETLLSDSPTPEEQALKRDERLLLYKYLQRLEPEKKDVVYLRIFGELSFKEIGEIIGKSENYARVTFYRSKNQLKGWMENEN